MITMEGRYQTRDGRPVRILCVDGPVNQPVCGLVEGESDVDQWHSDGRYTINGDKHWDLQQVPEPPKHIPFDDGDRDKVRDKWLKYKSDSSKEFSVGYFTEGTAGGWSWQHLLDNATFLDGQPFGKLA